MITILTAADIRRALSERPVKGTSASVCVVDETKKTLEVNKIERFSKLHNIQFEEKGIRVWRSYGVGRGKEIPFEELVLLSQENTGLVVSEECFDCRETRVYKCKDNRCPAICGKQHMRKTIGSLIEKNG